MGLVLNYFSNIMDLADPRISNHFLMGSPVAIVTIMALYLGFVYKFGPQLMRNRPPLKIENIIKIYNIVQIFANGLLFILLLREFPKMSIWCSPLDRSNTTHAITILNLHYWYLLLKIFDLLDTIFFILRKKNNQVSFLHVYHHSLMVTGGWITCKFFAGGQGYFLGVANLFVHVVMYFYYFLTSLDSSYKKNIWWKKHITQLQIVQHCFIFVSFLLPLFNSNCTYPKILLILYLIQAVHMIYLFSVFYYKTYLRKKEN